jgi:hypothetical protein
METHTTNIADLPIDHIPQNTALPEKIMNSSSSYTLDGSVQETPRHVAFNPRVDVRKIDAPDNTLYKATLIATLLFILFNEPFIRTYIMNILVVIFGANLKSGVTGTTTKLGNVFYGLFYGICIFIILYHSPDLVF